MRPRVVLVVVALAVALAGSRAAPPAASRAPPTNEDAVDDVDDGDDERAAAMTAMTQYWRTVERALADGSAEQQGMLQEGDILSLPPGLRNADADPHSLWPHREVVLDLAPGEWSPQDLRLLQDALQDIERESCVRFVRRTNQTDYLLLKHTGHSCASIVGFQEGVGPIPTFLGGSGCLRKGTIQHEMLHTLGMWHEHTRPDRDEHVTVLWGNIAPGRKPNFLRRPPGTVRTLGLPYDYGSVMHYRSVAFSRNGLPTIVPKVVQGLPLMGQRRRFSQLDIAKLNTLYNCPAPYYRKESVYLDNLLINLIEDSFPKRTNHNILQAT